MSISNKTVQMSLWVNILAMLMVLMWGTSFISTKYLLNNGLNASQIYIIRFGIAYIALLLFTYRDMAVKSWKDELIFLFCGLTGGSIYFIAENIAIEKTLVSNVGILVTTAPLLTAMVAKIFNRNESFGKNVIIGSVIAFSGVAFVIFNSSFKVKISPVGDILSLIAALSWAFYSISLRKVYDRYDVLVLTRKVFFYGIVTSIPFALFMDSEVTTATFTDGWVLFNLVFLGLGASMSAYIIWNYIVKCIGAVRSSNYLYISPIVTLLASVLLLDEQITLVGLVGCILILGGVVFSSKVSKDKN